VHTGGSPTIANPNGYFGGFAPSVEYAEDPEEDVEHIVVPGQMIPLISHPTEENDRMGRGRDRQMLTPVRPSRSRSPSPGPARGMPVFHTTMVDLAQQHPLENMFHQTEMAPIPSHPNGATIANMGGSGDLLMVPNFGSRPRSYSQESDREYSISPNAFPPPSSPGQSVTGGYSTEDDFDFDSLSVMGPSSSFDTNFKRKSSVTTPLPMPKVSRQGTSFQAETDGRPLLRPRMAPPPQQQQLYSAVHFARDSETLYVPRKAGEAMTPSSAHFGTPTSNVATPNNFFLPAALLPQPTPEAYRDDWVPEKKENETKTEESDGEEDADEEDDNDNDETSGGQKQRRGVNAGDGDRNRTTQSAEERRQVHILSEQKRRSNINNGFENLRETIPFSAAKKASKSKLLKLSAQYVQGLQQTRGELYSDLAGYRDIQHQTFM